MTPITTFEPNSKLIACESMVSLERPIGVSGNNTLLLKRRNCLVCPVLGVHLGKGAAIIPRFRAPYLIREERMGLNEGTKILVYLDRIRLCSRFLCRRP